LIIKPCGRPPTNDYQVYTAIDEEITLAIITVYDDGHITFEFNNDIIYSKEQIQELLTKAMEL